MVTCAYCSQELPVDENFAGDSILCANCGRATSIGPDTTRAEKPAVSRPPGSTPQQAYRQALLNSLSPPQGPDELGRLGNYRILQILGVGGMGVVFRAEDTQLKRPVALKTMLPELAADASAKKRFLREAQAAGSLKHNHIVTIHQVGEENGIPFLAMEFLDGESLEDRLNRGGEAAALAVSRSDKQNTLAGAKPVSKGEGGQPLPLAEILRIARQIAEGLAAAHERGLIHRDIKPLNIWLESTSEASSISTPRGEVLRTPRVNSTRSLPSVKILDFGLARIASEKTQLTEKGDVLGTLAYMAPEQLAGGEVDHRCDLFSLGCTLYRMCTGKLPSALALKPPTPPKNLNPEIPQALSDLVMQLLARDPADRPQTAHEVWERLDPLQTAPSAIQPSPSRDREEAGSSQGPAPSWAPQAPTPRRQSLLPYIFVAVTVLIGVALAVAFQQGLFTRTKEDEPNKNLASNVKPPPGDEPKKNGAATIPQENNIPPKPNPDEPNKGNGSHIKPVMGDKPIEPDHVLKKILERVRAENGSDNVRFLRFFSLHHLLASGAGPDEIEKQRQAFTKALNLLSRKKSPISVDSIDDPDNTIFVVDIRKLGWDERPFQRADNKKPADFNYFDLVLLEYPYGIWREKSAVFADLIDNFLVPADQIRPIVYIRGDWLVSAVTSRPLAKEIPALPITEEIRDSFGEVDRRFRAPLTMRLIPAELDVPAEDARKACAELKMLEGDSISREDWERTYDRLVTKLGLGIPVVPLDGLGRGPWQRSKDLHVTLTTNHFDNVFTKGERAIIHVTNKSEQDVFIEVLSTGIEGNKDIVTPKPVRLKPGEAYRIPEEGGIPISDKKGKDLVTVFASATKFPLGLLLSSKQNVGDRVVHSFYNLELEDAKQVMKFDPTLIVKKTIEIETK